MGGGSAFCRTRWPCRLPTRPAVKVAALAQVTVGALPRSAEGVARERMT